MNKNLTTIFLDYLKKGGVMKAQTGKSIKPKAKYKLSPGDRMAASDSIEVNRYGNDEIPDDNKGEYKYSKTQKKITWHPDHNWYNLKARLLLELLHNGVYKKQDGGEFEDPYAIAEQNNNRNAEISRQYFNSTPSIGNLAKGVYYWWKSLPFLGGETGSITGIAPAPGISRDTLQINGAVRVYRSLSKESRASVDNILSGLTDNLKKLFLNYLYEGSSPQEVLRAWKSFANQWRRRFYSWKNGKDY